MPPVPPVPPIPTKPSNITVQKQIYILTGVFAVFIFCLMVISFGTAYVMLGKRRLVLSGSASDRHGAAPAWHARSTRRQAPNGARDNAAFADHDDDDDDDDDDDYGGGDDLQRRFSQYGGQRPQSGRPKRPPKTRAPSAPRDYDRFHQPLPDARMPGDDRSRRPEPPRAHRDEPVPSRYGAGNLARLPKGPAPQPGGYDNRYPDEYQPRPQHSGQW
ncbi:proline-rich proteoglycan 2-like [Pollicipes pollicipes]|uniref:proline-rich proteoglycan 2-like n=1 Tax=Pollicipes pollicipes TaxID=41117 RepID=UPI00188563BF|nr:proline-rich proteoglycan 2-like [Pollicipes pollicipes]